MVIVIVCKGLGTVFEVCSRCHFLSCSQKKKELSLKSRNNKAQFWRHMISGLLSLLLLFWSVLCHWVGPATFFCAFPTQSTQSTQSTPPPLLWWFFIFRSTGCNYAVDTGRVYSRLMLWCTIRFSRFRKFCRQVLIRCVRSCSYGFFLLLVNSFGKETETCLPELSFLSTKKTRTIVELTHSSIWFLLGGSFEPRNGGSEPTKQSRKLKHQSIGKHIQRRNQGQNEAT